MSAPGARVWMAGIGALLAGAGCGFKGPLYLPERNATVVTHPAPTAQGASSPGQAQPPAAKAKGKSSAASAPQQAPSAPPP